MSAAPDGPPTRRPRPPQMRSGVVFALLSAVSFALSGSLARGLLDTGWSAGAAVLIRTTIGCLVLAPPAVAALRGRWHLLRRGAVRIVLYGVLAVATAQLCYFTAVTRIPVAVALLIEYTAPLPVLLWMWVRHRQRPSLLTLAGTGVAAVGLILVLGVVTGTRLDPVGVLWAMGAMVGASCYFILSAEDPVGVPPLALAAGGLLVGSLGLALAGVAGVIGMSGSTAPAVYAVGSAPAWVPLLALGVVTAAVAYLTGIEATRRLGSRFASFVALLEVVAALGFAYALLGELPRTTQLLGGVVILAGIVVVRFGEDRVARGRPDRSAAATDRSAA